MLWLTFFVGSSRYAIDARSVLQVIPRVALRTVPGTPDYVPGLVDLGGTVCPVVDLGRRLVQTPCAERLSTRIVVAQIDHEGRKVPLGLIAEGVTDLREVEASVSAATSPGTTGDILGPVLRIGDELIQWIEIQCVLPEPERAWLYARLAG